MKSLVGCIHWRWTEFDAEKHGPIWSYMRLLPRNSLEVTQT